MRKLLILFILMNSWFCYSQWITDPSQNNLLITSTYFQYFPALTTDGMGGAIVVMDDLRFQRSIFAQRIDRTGFIKWPTDGIITCSNPIGQSGAKVKYDGNGAAIILWLDARYGGTKSKFFAQKISLEGELLWNPDGIQIAQGNCYQIGDFIVNSDGSTIIAWGDQFCNRFDVYVQKLNSNGEILWGSYGKKICAHGNTLGVVLTSDGNDGAIIFWQDGRNGAMDIYTQRIDSDGNVLWQEDGKPICIKEFPQITVQAVIDRKGGAYILFEDYQNYGESELYVQRINKDGNVLWHPDGVQISNSPLEEAGLMIEDGDGGVIVTWWNFNIHGDLYAQKIDSNGIKQWGANGVTVSAAQGAQQYAQLISDDEEGAIISWEDHRNGHDIYAQRIDSEGIPRWASNGEKICTAGSVQWHIQMEKDGSGGALITWQDERDQFSTSYISQIDANGIFGAGPVSVESQSAIIPDYGLYQNFPNPFNPNTKIKYSIPTSNLVQIKLYDLMGSEIKTLLNEYKLAGTYEVEFAASNLPSGVYCYRMISGSYTETKKMILLR